MISFIKNRFESPNDAGVRNHHKRLFVPRDGKLKELDPRALQKGKILGRIILLNECPKMSFNLPTQFQKNCQEKASLRERKGFGVPTIQI